MCTLECLIRGPFHKAHFRGCCSWGLIFALFFTLSLYIPISHRLLISSPVNWLGLIWFFLPVDLSILFFWPKGDYYKLLIIMHRRVQALKMVPLLLCTTVVMFQIFLTYCERKLKWFWVGGFVLYKTQKEIVVCRRSIFLMLLAMGSRKCGGCMIISDVLCQMRRFQISTAPPW